jgi:2-phosphosulfolactate phosphatase
MFFDQADFAIRCEWGEPGVRALAPISDVVIIVDVLSFSTCVEIAVSRGATVYPYRGSAPLEFAASVDALLAGPEQNPHGYALSPQSLLHIRPGTRLVLPSPNGSALTLETGATPTLAGCLRNCRAVAEAAMRYGRGIALIPAGERWRGDWSLRPSFEDLLGAGAVISYLEGSLSPEAQAARAVFEQCKSDLGLRLQQCSSGKELIERGRAYDVGFASEFNGSQCVPVLKDGAYRQMEV